MIIKKKIDDGDISSNVNKVNYNSYFHEDRENKNIASFIPNNFAY